MAMLQEEIKERPDIYTYDALAWALYKNKKYEEAQQASAAALKWSTPEPAFYYHAGMIAAARNNRSETAKYLRRALELNWNFDPAQALRAQAKLRELQLN